MNPFNGRAKSPCINCESRTAECHAVCEDYLQFVKVRGEERIQIHKYLKKEKTFYRTEKEFINSINRRKKNRVFKDHKK